ncbi:MAG: hypothetical protein JXB00_12940 [Bacteroidales bacterium]|nr:hypothetical protein [Bacteroidales bacterium]
MDDDIKKPVLIAIPTNDGITIFPEMLGMAKFFFIYRINNDREFILTEKRGNPFEKTKQHLKTLDVYSVIDDCKIIIAALIGKKGIQRFQNKRVLLLFKKGNIGNVLRHLTKDELFNR